MGQKSKKYTKTSNGLKIIFLGLKRANSLQGDKKWQKQYEQTEEPEK
jgi:hypothetical protein